MTDGFSTSSSEAISRTLDVHIDPQLSPKEDFDDFYEIERVAREITGGDFNRIALQFPDSLLPDSVSIFQKLKRKIGPDRELYVLADTSYGSCCVDEVAAQHVNADLLIHYGHACLSQPSRLPVVYVFGKSPIDVDDCVSKLSAHATETETETILLRHEVGYTHLAESIVDKLRASHPQLSIRYTKLPTKLFPSSSSSFPPSPSPPQDKEDPTPETETILYIGPSTSLTLTNILITHPSSTVYSYNPATRTTHLESSHTSKSLMRRYATLQKARDADVFGILVGTLGVASYLPLLTHIRTTLTRSRKKSYTISVGKLNPSKLANFMEIECFVLVACPENSLIDSKEFYRPIVTPYELQVALRDEPSWLEGSYVFDFGRLLVSDPGPREEKEDEDEDEDQPVFSLITGKYRHAKRYGTNPTPAPENENENSTALIGNDNGGRGSLTKFTSSSAASQFLLHSRTYQGLEPRLGEDDPGVLEQGRKGVARGYGEV
ncbi:Diphthamide biosynthesis protein 2 [Marasmius tenuissimus]|nr:Diphthamide biosynthesis protein 2 [Marasmius tenuissimus]